MRRLPPYLITGMILLLMVGSVQPSSAHGKEVEIVVTSLIPDPGQPLTRLYRAQVRFADGDPVDGATMELTATREEGGQAIGPIAFYALGEPGLYATEVAYERFGNWVVTVTVSAPGEGAASFTDAILPGQAGSAEPASAPSASLPANLAVLFKFDGLDLLNIVFRFVHSLAGLAWFALIAVILVAHWFMDPPARYRALLQLRGIFAPVAGLSLAVLLGSGIYNAVWDSPIRPPGVFDLSTLLQVPFGDVYLIAFLGKLLAYAVLAGVSVRLQGALRALPAAGTAPSNPGHHGLHAIARLAQVGLGTAVFLAVNIAVLIYMHYISHLAIVIPQ